MLLQDPKSSPQKSRPFGSGHRRHGVWLAIGYSYKLGQKMNLNFHRIYYRAVRYHLKFVYHDTIVRVLQYTLGIDTSHDMAYMR